MGYSNSEVGKTLCTCYLIPVFVLRWQPPSMLDVVSSHPTETVLSIYLLPMTAVLFTAPESWLRLAVCPIISILVAAYVQCATTQLDFNTRIAGQLVLVLLTSINILVLQRLYLNGDGEEQTVPLGKENLVRKSSGRSLPLPRVNMLKWAWNTVWSYRAIGTPRQVKNTPQFSYNNKDYTPSRAKFLTQQAKTILFSLLVLDFLLYIWEIDQSADLSLNGTLFIGINQLSLEDWYFRIVSAAWFWIITRLLLEVVYDIFSILFVGLMIDSPRDWPPYFGPISSAYTLREFWSVFWHQGFRFITGHADFWVYGVFCQQKGTLVARYLHLFIVFFISGMQHSVDEACIGVPASEALACLVFILHFCGIIAEDAVQYLFRLAFSTDKASIDSSVGKSGNKNDNSAIPTWHKVVGYAWVSLFLVWSTPGWVYTIARYNPICPPFSITGWAVEKISIQPHVYLAV